MAARRDFEALERRRREAAGLFTEGRSQAEVARQLEVSAQAVSNWHRAWVDGGPAALAGAGRAGRQPRLSDDQLAQVVEALKKGPRANGFSTDLWTLARVADVIETTAGIRLGQTQTWDTLSRRLGWSRQRPARRALERNDEAIANWVANDWPRIRKTPGADGPGSSSKTSRGSRSSLR